MLWTLFLLLVYAGGVIFTFDTFPELEIDIDKDNKHFRFGYALGAIFWPLILIGLGFITIKETLESRKSD